MRFVARPAAPPALGKLVDGMTELERARLHFEGTGNEDGFNFVVYSDPQVKQALKEAFNGMCAYCESYYDSTQTEDVEHFRPKGRIDNGEAKLTPGYWWLASDWTNLLPSCILCNRTNTVVLFDGTVLTVGKLDRFPILDETKRATQEGGEVHEAPLLLNPCVDKPMAFLEFEDRNGECIIVERSKVVGSPAHERARKSIDIYGLNRRGLVKDRSRTMIRIQVSLRKLERAIARLNAAQSPQLQVDALADIKDERLLLATYVDGADRFTGMARWLIDPVLRRLGLAP